jgi:soluble lytic murein transglycosylase-like protein
MSKTVHHGLRRIGIVFHGQKIWISELLSVFFSIVMLIVLFSLSFSILKNESAIHHNNQKCAVLRAEKAKMNLLLVQLAAQERIAQALKSVVGNTIAPVAYYQLVDLVYSNSKTYGYDPLLVLAVMQVESVFKPQALGRYKDKRLSGALGLMQVKPETAREIAHDLGIPIASNTDLFKPEINLAIGVAYLTKLIGAFKSFKLGLLAYNQGPGAIKERLQENQPQSIAYYDRVLKKYYALKKSTEQRF